AETGEAGRVGERVDDRYAVDVGEPAGRVGDRITVARQRRRARTELRRGVPGAEQRLVAEVAAGFGGQRVGDRARRRGGLAELHRPRVRAQGVTAGAVHRHADVVRGLRVLERTRVRDEL